MNENTAPKATGPYEHNTPAQLKINRRNAGMLLEADRHLATKSAELSDGARTTFAEVLVLAERVYANGYATLAERNLIEFTTGSYLSLNAQAAVRARIALVAVDNHDDPIGVVAAKAFMDSRHGRSVTIQMVDGRTFTGVAARWNHGVMAVCSGKLVRFSLIDIKALGE